MEYAWEAAVRYEAYRQAARDTTHEELQALAEAIPEIAGTIRRVRLTGIGGDEIDAWNAQWVRTTFDWDENVSLFRPYLNRFEVAIWHGSELCGMGIGRPSKGDHNVTIHFVERRFENNPLTGWVALIVTDSADGYAKVLGKHWVRLKQPTDLAIRRYEALGFSLAGTVKGVTYKVRYEPT